jgi:hypothetical protein
VLLSLIARATKGELGIMEMTEKERSMLERERDEIKKLALEILELENDPKNSTELKKRVTGIQFSINRMVSYSNIGNRKLEGLTIMTEALLSLLSMNPPKDVEEALEKEIQNPSEELKKRLKEKHLKLEHQPLNVAYPAWWGFVVDGLDKYCNYVNSIRFDFTKKGLINIVLPRKIVLPDINFIFSNK